MSGLAQIQARFQDHLLGRCEAPDDLVRHPAGDDSASDRLDIYRNAYAARLVGVLRQDFPGVAALAGEGFDDLARAYLARHPSTAPAVRQLGRHFAEFLDRRDPVLAGMARFEWALAAAFDAPDCAPLTFADLAGLPPDAWTDLRLLFVPSLRRLDLDASVPEAWSAVQEGRALPSPGCGAAMPWVVWRRDLTPHFRPLAADEATMLDAARNGAGFGVLCQSLCVWHAPEAASARAAGLLRAWLDQALVAATGRTSG
jgi:hypothetical protein